MLRKKHILAAILDSPMLTSKFSKGDKVFESISRNEFEKVLKDAGEIRVGGSALIFAVRYVLASYSKYDFGYSCLRNRLGVEPYEMRNLYKGTGYSLGVPFTRFEGSNVLYNLPDAGKFYVG